MILIGQKAGIKLLYQRMRDVFISRTMLKTLVRNQKGVRESDEMIAPASRLPWMKEPDFPADCPWLLYPKNITSKKTKIIILNKFMDVYGLGEVYQNKYLLKYKSWFYIYNYVLKEIIIN